MYSPESGQGEWAYPPETNGLRARMPELMQSKNPRSGRPARVGDKIYLSVSSYPLIERLKELGVQKPANIELGMVLSFADLAANASSSMPGGTELTFYQSGKAYLRLRWAETGGKPMVDGGAGGLPKDVVEEYLRSASREVSILEAFRVFLLHEPRVGLVVREEKVDDVFWRMTYQGGLADDGTGWSGLSLKEQQQWVPREADFMRQVLAAATMLLLIPVFFLAMLVAFRLGRRISQPVLAVRDALQRIAAGDFSVRVVEDRNDEIGQLQTFLNRTASELRKRESIKELMGKYLSKQVADRIMESDGGAALADVRKEITVLFADVRGFTSYSEKHDPEQVTKSLNEYFEVMVEVIAGHEGVLDKYIGDGLMVVFGSPVPQPDHVARAVITALEMQAALQSLNLKRMQRGDEPIQIGIGINTGLAISGNLGAIQRMEFTVIGDTVNTAARLESRAEKGQILIGKATYEKAKELVDAEALGPITVKGKSEPVEVWVVKGLTGRLPR
jgi:class 3 adenylate cyclase